jgi:hypothetical protein
MKINIILVSLIILIAGCSINQDEKSDKTTNEISGTKALLLNEQDLQQIGITGYGCQTDEEYSNIVDSSLGQYSLCNYTINNFNDTGIIVELQKFDNYEALNGSYQYSSLHLYGIKGLISENKFGDQSRFRVNSDDDYGAQYNEPGIYFYHLWICKDLYLIHITSGGRSKEAEDYITKIGQQILSKFG